QALRKVAPEADVRISGDVADIRSADRLVLPGQGAIPDCMHSLQASGVKGEVLKAAQSRPLFGVCVGEQMMLDWSEEGDTPGLGLFPGKVVRFRLDGQVQEDGSRIEETHMRCYQVRKNMDQPLWQGIADASYIYFVYSYYAKPVERANVANQTPYGAHFCSAIASD